MECKLCGKEYVKVGKNVFCSPECKREYRRIHAKDYNDKRVQTRYYETRICEICGEKFKKRIDSTNYTCSRRCYMEKYNSSPYETKKIRTSHIDALNTLAVENGMTYGQLQAIRYLATHSEARVKI